MKKLAWLLLTSASLTQVVWAADDLMSSQLADEARQWQQKDRNDIAADLWRKLLRADPMHPEALVKLGLIEVRAGNIQEAEVLHSRASQLAAQPAGLFELSAALRTLKGSPANLLPLPTKQLPSKPIEKAAKTNRDKALGAKPASPPPPGSPLKAKIQPTTPRQTEIRIEERSMGTEVDGLDLKISPTIDLVHGKTRP